MVFLFLWTSQIVQGIPRQAQAIVTPVVLEDVLEKDLVEAEDISLGFSEVELMWMVRSLSRPFSALTLRVCFLGSSSGLSQFTQKSEICVCPSCTQLGADVNAGSRKTQQMILQQLDALHSGAG